MKKNEQPQKPDGAEYDKYMPKAYWKETKVIQPIPAMEDLLFMISEIIKRESPRMEQVAEVLKAENKEKTLEKVFDFVNTHITYSKHIPLNNEMKLRTPARTWFNREGDIADLVMFISSILKAQQILHYLKLVKYKQQLYYSHLYIIVPITEPILARHDYIVLDIITGRYNFESKYTFATLLPITKED